MMNAIKNLLKLAVPGREVYRQISFSRAQLLYSHNVIPKRLHHSVAVLKQFGEPLVVEEAKKATLEDGQVRVDVYSCGVNAVDVLMTAPGYEIQPKLPFIPGFEFSGEITEVGNGVKHYKPGDRIIGLNKELFGGLSQEIVINHQDVWKMPQSMHFDQAAALTDCYATALIAIRRANVKPGDLVLVTAAAGGLGLAAVDIAANMFEAKVIGACGTEDKASLVREKGAFSAVNYNKREIVDAVQKFSDGKGVKVVIDAVGGEMFQDILDCVAHEGSIVVAGFASRQIPAVRTNQLLPKSCGLIGVSLSQYRLNVNDIYRATVQEVIELYSDSYIEPHISKTFPINEVNEAMDYVKLQKSTGKVVIDIR